MKTSRVETDTACLFYPMLFARDYTLARDRERLYQCSGKKSNGGSMLHAIVSFLANLLDRNFLPPRRVGEDQLDQGSFTMQTAITPGTFRCKVSRNARIMVDE